MDGFTLHPKLAADTWPVASLEISELLLMNDARFPWCILVPRFDGLREWHDVPDAARLPLLSELERTSRVLLELPGVTKINVGALGNLVPQLHIHVVGRHAGDAAWPGPVWGSGPAVPYEAAQARRLLKVIGSGIG